MEGNAMKRDIEAVYRLAEVGVSLSRLMEAIGGVLARHGDELQDITASYRLQSSDTEYIGGFALERGQYRLLGDQEEAEVTVIGKERDLLAVFQRKLSPMAALLRGKIKVKGNKGALIKLGEFL